MNEQTPEALIRNIISFIEKERELFGDFSVPQSASGPDSNYQQISPGHPETIAVKESLKKQSVNLNPEPVSVQSQDAQDASSETIYDHIDQCNTLEELEALCTKAGVLETDLKETRLVFGTGNPDADLMLIGEAPGAEEDKQGKPFVGAAGQLLNKILASVGFEREDVYIANILKHRPPNNRNPLPEERERSLPFLLRQIDLVNPKLILALGKVAAQTLLGSNKSLGKIRGEFHSFCNKYELLATYHPAALLRYEKWKRPTWEDMQLLRKRYDELGGKP